MNITLKQVYKLFTLIAFAISTLLLLQCKDNKTSEGEWKTYNGDSFVIDFPANWDVDSSGLYDVQSFTCLSPETGNKKETLSFGIILVVDSADLLVAVNNFMNKWGFNSSKPKAVEIGKRNGLYVEANTDNVFFHNYFIKQDDILYFIFFAGESDAVKMWADKAKAMVNSFRIL